MNRVRALLLTPLLILLALNLTIIPIHAATGLVCLTDTFTSGCPGSPASLFQSVGSKLSVVVQIQGSDDLNGFNIQIQTDISVLRAVNASLSGSILGSGASVILECLDGTVVVGAHCDPSDVPGTLHYSATKLGANVPGNGLLFTAVYNVTAVSSGTNLNLPMVTISNGTFNPDSETVQGAVFSNTSNYFISANPSTIITGPNVSKVATLNFSSTGGYTDFATITLTPSSGLAASTADSGVFIPPDSFVTTILNVTAATAGTYTVVVTATPSDQNYIHSITVTVTVTPFTMTATISTNLEYAGGLGSIGQSAVVTIKETITNYQATSQTAHAFATVSNTTTVSLGSQTGTVAGLGGVIVFTFSWNTTGAKYAWWNYNATANVGTAPYTKLIRTRAIRIIALGDIDQNGAVTITDLSIVYFDFGFTPANPGRWSPYADMNNNGIIDIIDVGIVTRNFGIRT